LKFLFFSYLDWYAGSERMLPILMNHLAQEKENEIVFVCNSDAEYVKNITELLDKKIEIIPLKLFHIDFKKRKDELIFFRLILNLISYLKFIVLKYYFVILNRNKISKAIDLREYDTVHINNGGYPGSFAAIGFVLFCYSLKFNKLFFVVNNLAVSRKHPLRMFDRPLDFLVKNRVTSFVTASNFAGERLKSVLQTPKVRTIPNAVVLDSKSLGHNHVNNNLVVGMIGILEKRKGHALAISAMKKVVAIIPNAVLLIEGEGELRDSLQQLIEDLGLHEHVRLMGREENIWSFYARLDILIFTSVDNEDMPNVISESQGLGIPVVSHKIAGTIEQVIHDNTGYLVDIGDEEKLVNYIQLLNNEKRRRDFAENARKNYLLNFSPEVSINNYIKLYNY